MSFRRPELTDFPYFPADVKKSTSIELNDLKPGCQKPDCIPSIDNPQWIDYQAIKDQWEETEEILVMFVPSNDGSVETYGFPITIMDYHEIVNFTDSKGTKVALTYCPLCQTATSYRREIDGEELELGVSGLLMNSALVLFDRKSMSLFSQVWSKGIVGKYVDQEIPQLPIIQTSIIECADMFAETKFLSHDTGFPHHQKRYGKYPYLDYKTSEKIRFPVSLTDDQLHSKELVFIIEEKFLDSSKNSIFIHKQSDLVGNIQHEGYYSVAVAGGRLFFKGEMNESNLINFRLWIPNGISFYFAARAYFPSAELK